MYAKIGAIMSKVSEHKMMTTGTKEYIGNAAIYLPHSKILSVCTMDTT